MTKKQEHKFGIVLVFKDNIQGMNIANFETCETAYLGASDVVNLVANIGKTLSVREPKLEGNVEKYKAVGEKKASLSKLGLLVVSEAAPGARLLAASDAVARFAVDVGSDGLKLLQSVAATFTMHLETAESVKKLMFKRGVKKAVVSTDGFDL